MSARGAVGRRISLCGPTGLFVPKLDSDGTNARGCIVLCVNDAYKIDLAAK